MLGSQSIFIGTRRADLGQSLFDYFFKRAVKASPSTKIFFLLIPAGKAKISITDKKIIKSKGNLPIPYSEKANANVCNCMSIFLGRKNLYWILKFGKLA